MTLEFVKMEGLGNDFILLDDRTLSIKEKTDYPSLSRRLCSRHFGIGADGIILILAPEDGDIKFRIYNSDGSQAQMCGNGMRCFAKYLYEQKILPQKKMVVETRAGIVIPEVKVDENDTVLCVTVDMGEPILSCPDIPFNSQHQSAVEEALAVGSETFLITAVSMGNPHAVIFVDDVRAVQVDEIGPLIETHERFPEKTNVEFIEVVNPGELKMKVWERGAGITLACGTGACAAVVAAFLTGRSDRQAVVHLDGGDLEIVWDKDTNHIFKTGPANYVFNGWITL